MGTYFVSCEKYTANGNVRKTKQSISNCAVCDNKKSTF